MSSTPPPTPTFNQWSQPKKPSGKRTLVVVLSIAAGVVVLMMGTCLIAILLPALGKASQAAQRIKGKEQIRNLAQGLTLIAFENDDVFPGPDEDWGRLLVDADHASAEMLVAPAAEPGQVSYFYVPGLVSDFDMDQVLIFENPAIYDNGGANVAYVDGHVEWLEGDALWRELDAITLEDGTPYRPHRGEP